MRVSVEVDGREVCPRSPGLRPSSADSQGIDPQNSEWNVP
jgi:hypothetical protein